MHMMVCIVPSLLYNLRARQRVLSWMGETEGERGREMAVACCRYQNEKEGGGKGASLTDAIVGTRERKRRRE